MSVLTLVATRFTCGRGHLRLAVGRPLPWKAHVLERRSCSFEHIFARLTILLNAGISLNS
jgi:hypothetical protein